MGQTGSLAATSCVHEYLVHQYHPIEGLPGLKAPTTQRIQVFNDNPDGAHQDDILKALRRSIALDPPQLYGEKPFCLENTHLEQLTIHKTRRRLIGSEIVRSGVWIYCVKD